MAKTAVTEAAKAATPTSDFVIAAENVKDSDIQFAQRVRSSAYDGLIAQLHGLKSGTGVVVAPSDPKVLKNRPEFLKLRNRLAAVARRAAKSHPKSFTFSVGLADNGIAIIAYKPEA